MMTPILRFIAKIFLRVEWAQLRSEVSRRETILDARGDYAVPLIVQRLLVSGEDHRHSYHGGFDAHAICRAIWRRIADGRREGASTIEQQIVRVLTNRFEPTLRRKFRELLLATLLVELIPKAAMPQFYLRIGYFGWRMNGFIQACRRLSLRPNSMSLDAAAALVARLKYPEPRVLVYKRLAQIERRKRHLKQLYWHHLADGTYDYLGGYDVNETIRNGSRLNEFEFPVS